MKKFIYFLNIAFLISSCSKNETFSEEIIDSSEATNFSSLDTDQLPCSDYDMLVFSSMDEFEYVLGELNDGKSLASVNLDGFYSLLDYYADVGVPQIDDIIYDSNFSNLLSPEGEIQIGTKIYKVTNYFVLEYEDCNGKESALKTIDSDKQNLQQGIPGEIFVQDESYKVFIPEHENLIENEHRASEVQVVEFQENKFLMGHMWRSNWFFYASIGTRTLALEKKKYLFWHNYYLLKLKKINVDWDVHFNFLPIQSNPTEDFSFCLNNECSIICNSDINESGGKSASNSALVKKIFDWSVGFGVSLSGGNFSGVNGLPGAGTFFSYWRHKDNQNTLSNHSGVLGQSAFSTPTNFWNECP